MEYSEEQKYEYALTLFNQYRFIEALKNHTEDSYTEATELPKGVSVEEAISRYKRVSPNGWMGNGLGFCGGL